MPSCSQFALSISTTISLLSVTSSVSGRCCLLQNLSSRAPLLHLHYRDFLATTGSSASPIRLLNFVYPTYINSPYWIGPSQLWYLTFPETPWPIISAGAPDSDNIRFISHQVFQPSLRSNKGRPPEYLANDFTQEAQFRFAVFALC